MERLKIGTLGLNPYKNFRFRVRWGDGSYIGGFSKATGLDITFEVPDYRAGSAAVTVRKLPVATHSVNVSFLYGVTRDSGFAKWISLATQTWRGDLRRDLIVETCNEAGAVVSSVLLYHAWVTEFQGLGDLDANANSVQIATLRLGGERCEKYPP